MNDFFNRLFGKSHPPAESQRHEKVASTQDDPEDTTRHLQLMQMVLRKLLRKHSIPGDWIELKAMLLPNKGRGQLMHVRLVIRHWDANLMNHTQAFQEQFLLELKRCEPQFRDWLHGLSWQLEMGSSCPYPTLPDKPFWTVPGQPGAAPAAAAPAAAVVHVAAVAPAAAAPAPPKAESDEHADLERMFADRDQQLKKSSDSGYLPTFQDTQPLDEDENPHKEGHKR